MKSMEYGRQTSDPGAGAQPGDGKFSGVEADVVMPATDLAVEGMTCQNCQRHVREAIEGIPGVSAAKVDLASGRARIQWKDDAPRNIDAIVQAISAAGFAAHPVVAGREVVSEPPAGADWRTNVVVGLGVLAVLMAGEWILGWTHKPWFRWLSLVLAMPVQFYCGARFYRGAWRQLKSGNSNMDTLVSLGSTAAFGFSVWELLAGGSSHLFFLESVAIVTLISVGHWLEAQMSAKAASALEALMHLAPDTAWRLEATGECQVPVAALKPADRLVLRPGDRVPTDAEVIDGQSAVDESMLTGESMPVNKSPGAKLYAGTVNQDGRLIASVTAIGQETALAKIIQMVEHAQNSRARIQRLGDRVSSVFVPLVIGVAVAAFLWWGLAPEKARHIREWVASPLWMAPLSLSGWPAGLVCAIGVLIVACPCAMGLATPAAIMAGTNAAARRGILVRDGMALEKSGHITAVAFDKTGTLTTGQIVLSASEDFRPTRERQPELDRLASSLAQPSRHPLSLALSRHRNDYLALIQWQEIRGSGVQARLQKASPESPLLRLGSLAWLRAVGIDVQPAEAFFGQWSAQGATVLGLANGHELCGVLAMSDQLKPHAASVVAQLNQQGKEVFLVTGDHRRTAESLARAAGIALDHVYAEVAPDRKAEILRQLQQRGYRVAFVGDGINDAPALEQADLGVAVSRASDVAREAADIILLKSEIQAIPEALGLAQATLRTIKQNLFWAFFYNAAAIPLAAIGLMSPILCAAAMGLSDLVVIGNALRLRGWKAGRGSSPYRGNHGIDDRQMPAS